jgi:glycosyltransferase involved in cell wall biosynthesis
LIVFGLPLLPALRQNVIFVRPTRAEGDAVSIREAQAAGVPVVASNVGRRPPGVVLFETEDVACLCDAVRAVLGNSAPPRKPSSDQAEAPPANQFAEALIQLYRRELMAQVPPDQ